VTVRSSSGCPAARARRKARVTGFGSKLDGKRDVIAMSEAAGASGARVTTRRRVPHSVSRGEAAGDGRQDADGQLAPEHLTSPRGVRAKPIVHARGVTRASMADGLRAGEGIPGDDDCDRAR